MGSSARPGDPIIDPFASLAAIAALPGSTWMNGRRIRTVEKLVRLERSQFPPHRPIGTVHFLEQRGRGLVSRSMPLQSFLPWLRRAERVHVIAADA